MQHKVTKAVNTISDELIQEIQSRLAEGKQVRRTLPNGGRLHIDRTLPFLVVYRKPSLRSDEGTEELVKGEASYLIASNKQKIKPDISKLVQSVAKTLSERCGSALIIELFSDRENPPENNLAPGIIKPHFQVTASSMLPPTKTMDVLQKALKRIKVLKHTSTVEVACVKNYLPKGYSRLISNAEAKKHSIFIISLIIRPIYRDAVTGEVYPLLLRNLQRGFATALRHAEFEFTRRHTSLHPLTYQALGRKAVVKAVWAVDSQLSNISNSFDFLLQVTPINIDAEWLKFQKSHFERKPVLYYRPLPVDPPILKRELYQIRIEDVEDPTLAYIFREKQIEIDRKLTMLWDRGTPEFLAGSQQLFGGSNGTVTEIAKDILEKLPPRNRDESVRNSLNAKEFAERARDELAFYQRSLPELTSEVVIRPDISGLMVSRGNLLVGKESRIPTSRVQALIQHEIGTHIVTFINGGAQPFQLLRSGLPGYDALQEGLAVLSEYLVGGLSRTRMRLLAARVIAVDCLLSGATFIDTFREINQTYSINQRTAFGITVRVFRGGGLTKDVVYLRGLVELMDYLKNGGKIEPLFIGKIATLHIPLIRELQQRGVLKPVLLMPRLMDSPDVKSRLKKLKNGLKPLNLTERS